MELIGIRVDKKMKEELEKLAEKDGRSLSNYCREALKDHIRSELLAENEEYLTTAKIFFKFMETIKKMPQEQAFELKVEDQGKKIVIQPSEEPPESKE